MDISLKLHISLKICTKILFILIAKILWPLRFCTQGKNLIHLTFDLTVIRINNNN